MEKENSSSQAQTTPNLRAPISYPVKLQELHNIYHIQTSSEQDQSSHLYHLEFTKKMQPLPPQNYSSNNNPLSQSCSSNNSPLLQSCSSDNNSIQLEIIGGCFDFTYMWEYLALFR